MRSCLITKWIGLVLVLLLLSPGYWDKAWAQEDAPVEETADPTDAADVASSGGTGVSDSFLRIGFYEWTTQRFQGIHPFYKMTGNKFFKEGNTSLNSTQDNTGWFLDPPQNHEIDLKSSEGTKLAHGLPPVSLEWIMPTGWNLLTAHSLAVYYTNTWLTDQTAQNGAKRLSDVPLIELRSHYYFLSYSVYGLFPPGRDQTELFYGFGFVYIESTIRNGLRSHGTINKESRDRFMDLDHYHSEQPIFFQRIGMTTSAENFGITFELYLLSDTPAMRNPFYKMDLLPTPETTIAKRIDLQGLLLRLTWGVYSFWD
ncbi:MAG: hypothetical protein HQM14_08575 [SAR324 cluster bacterium]|nr:hypothetical protein [SAR324 cluster bacterium]